MPSQNTPSHFVDAYTRRPPSQVPSQELLESRKQVQVLIESRNIIRSNEPDAIPAVNQINHILGENVVSGIQQGVGDEAFCLTVNSHYTLSEADNLINSKIFGSGRELPLRHPDVVVIPERLGSEFVKRIQEKSQARSGRGY